MGKKTTLQQLEKLVNNIDEKKETVIVIHFDWETNNLGMCAAGDNAHLASMVAASLEEDPNENPITKSLLTGFAVADHVYEGKIMHLVKEMENKAKGNHEK